MGSAVMDKSNANDTDNEITTRDLHSLDYGAISGILRIAAAAVVCHHNDRLRLSSHRLSSSTSSSNISLTTRSAEQG